MTRTAAYAALSAAVLGLYLVMVLWTLPAIKDAAGGLAPFDLRPFGYSVAEARAFAETLSDYGRALYLGPQHRLDTLFPALLVVWSCWTLLKLLPRRVAVALWAVVVLGMIGDYGENISVTSLLTQFDEATAQAASRFTIVKSMASTLVYTVMIGALIALGLKRLRR
ncbi:hypothetical protein [Tropicibacter naphthalenivorans]|uniref:Uncharacterized protein n=1 Tax=Tropicibacter naphthalenivorans TaxID=441103 RepID=A0A0P1GKA1_9RHOB|nr:hypothetical protein [Tropicibacter naphthalenivorans]CUH82485.1 hypothetical protein TRN7648_04027 [Tropicibacter naphthalenivorans]SMD07149.1 hypothetical protein SAMN04488093_11534 [Tropicibacter naphthalenivorans]